jgi:ribosome-binding protein aMBF1 (putative translation factor)
MLTGNQIRKARALLRLSQPKLAEMAKVRPEMIERVENTEGVPNITGAHAAALRRTLERAGVDFTNGDEPGVKLRKRSESST